MKHVHIFFDELLQLRYGFLNTPCPACANIGHELSTPGPAERDRPQPVIEPIADLYKAEVRELGLQLGISEKLGQCGRCSAAVKWKVGRGRIPWPFWGLMACSRFSLPFCDEFELFWETAFPY